MNNLIPGKIRHAVRGLRGMFGPRAAILLYHRVAESISDPYLLRVTPKHFAEHLQVICEGYRLIRLGEMTRRMGVGKLPERAVCVTFDDGYLDNLYTAKPLLRRYDVPATVFMTTGSIGRSREFWWDELERIFLQPGRLPVSLDLIEDGRDIHWDLGETSVYSEYDLHRSKEWTLLDSNDPTLRHAALRTIHGFLMQMGAADQLRVLDRLLRWAGMAPTVRPLHRALELDEVVELERCGIVEIGAHTVNHLDLSAQSTAVQREEIIQNKSCLEHCLGHPVKSFAYPYGLHSPTAQALVREAGFDFACGGPSGTVRQNSNLYLLPRLEVLNWDGEAFARQLRKHLGT